MRLGALVQERVELSTAGGIETDNLAVEHGAVLADGGAKGIAQAGERPELVIVPGHQATGATLDVRHCPKAVPFQFEQPLGMVERITAFVQAYRDDAGQGKHCSFDSIARAGRHLGLRSKWRLAARRVESRPLNVYQWAARALLCHIGANGEHLRARVQRHVRPLARKNHD